MIRDIRYKPYDWSIPNGKDNMTRTNRTNRDTCPECGGPCITENQKDKNGNPIYSARLVYRSTAKEDVEKAFIEGYKDACRMHAIKGFNDYCAAEMIDAVDEYLKQTYPTDDQTQKGRG